MEFNLSKLVPNFNLGLLLKRFLEGVVYHGKQIIQDVMRSLFG